MESAKRPLESESAPEPRAKYEKVQEVVYVRRKTKDEKTFIGIVRERLLLNVDIDVCFELNRDGWTPVERETRVAKDRCKQTPIVPADFDYMVKLRKFLEGAKIATWLSMDDVADSYDSVDDKGFFVAFNEQEDYRIPLPCPIDNYEAPGGEGEYQITSSRFTFDIETEIDHFRPQLELFGHAVGDEKAKFKILIDAERCGTCADEEESDLYEFDFFTLIKSKI